MRVGDLTLEVPRDFDEPTLLRLIRALAHADPPAHRPARSRAAGRVIPGWRIGHFAGGAEGAHRACVLLGVVTTCRALGVPVQAY